LNRIATPLPGISRCVQSSEVFYWVL
jgi:hypothetical protein